MPSIWRAPAGTIPSAEAVQAREHPCGQSLPSSLTRPLSHAASLAERFRTLLPLIPHVANATMAQPQVRSASLQSQAPQRKQQQLRVRSRPSPPLRSYPVRSQRTRSRVPMTRRFLHNAPWLSSVSRCLGPTQRRDPVSSSIGGQPHQLIAQRRPITASRRKTEAEFEPDTRARFERAVDIVAKSPPQHRTAKKKKKARRRGSAREAFDNALAVGGPSVNAAGEMYSCRLIPPVL